MERKVKISLTLVGKSRYGSDNFKDLSNEEILLMIENQITEQFGARPIFVHNRKKVSSDFQYPEFYAAGWFVSDDPISNTNGVGSELVVVAHGENMKSAKSSMMQAISTVDWDKLAKNIL